MNEKRAKMSAVNQFLRTSFVGPFCASQVRFMYGLPDMIKKTAYYVGSAIYKSIKMLRTVMRFIIDIVLRVL